MQHQEPQSFWNAKLCATHYGDQGPEPRVVAGGKPQTL
jgi:hypothetical protein